MKAVIDWLAALVADVPLPLLEVWGRCSYVIGFALALCAFGGFTFRVGRRWGFAREQHAWNGKAVLAIPLTFVAILASGYLGSFIVLVPGAQTFESLKDLVVFLCIVLLGYPALLAVPFAYGLSDLIEGVPPDFLLAWLPGYFINPACFWLAYQLIGKDPDFRRPRTWLVYLLFVLSFMALEPVLWGYICSDKYTPVISYQAIVPALFFTTTVTWALAPFAMLGALPLARRFGMFWAEIPGHVRERVLGSRESAWEAGHGRAANSFSAGEQGVPIRILILGPFIALVLLMVGATAYVTLRSAADDANRLAGRLHEEIAQNINQQLDEYLERAPSSEGARAEVIARLLKALPIAGPGRAFIVDGARAVVASSAAAGDAIVSDAIASFAAQGTSTSAQGRLFRFDHVTSQPLSRETWLVHAHRYSDRSGGHGDWTLLTAMPESWYLAGVQAGKSRSAMVFAVALLASLAVAALLASIVAAPLRRIASATQVLARGELAQRVPGSPLDELNRLALAFNRMAEQLEESFQSLKRSENRIQIAVKAANLGIWDWDVEHDRLLWDDSMYRLYGLEKGRFGGAYEAWQSQLLPEDRERALADVQAALRGEREFASEFRVRGSDGSVRSLRGVGLTIRAPDGRPLRMIGVNWDVTAQLRAEQELREHRDRLEELVRERTQALNHAKEQADAANVAKSSFLANMSHEIRTPMNAILGFGQLMERESQLSPRDRERLSKMLASGRHLLQLINNVLEMSKIEAGRMMLSVGAFDLHEAVADVDAMVRNEIEGRGLSFSVEGVAGLPRRVEGDVSKLRQVLLNLLGNAAKFTPRGGITLRASVQLTGEHASLRFAVEDTGVGIAGDELERVFEPFGQTASGVSAQTGTGLGMPISRSIARLMGGDITVRSTPGVGTTFELEVGVRVVQAAETAQSVARRERIVGLEPGQKRPLVLVVDDEPDNRLALSELLAGVGIGVIEAADGASAVAQFAQFGPDLVFMDLKMPVMDGVEATRNIRNYPRGEQVPIVILSASVLEGERALVAQSSANAFLAKPFDADDIFAAIEQHLDVRFVRQHERASSVGPTPRLTRERVAALGAETVAELRRALETGYLERVPELLAKTGPEHSATVAALSKLAADFQIEALIALL